MRLPRAAGLRGLAGGDGGPSQAARVHARAPAPCPRPGPVRSQTRRAAHRPVRAVDDDRPGEAVDWRAAVVDDDGRARGGPAAEALPDAPRQGPRHAYSDLGWHRRRRRLRLRHYREANDAQLAKVARSDLYQAAVLNFRKMLLEEKRDDASMEATADYYRAYVQRLKGHEDALKRLFGDDCFTESAECPETDPRRYLGVLAGFLGGKLEKDTSSLPQGAQTLLTGLEAVLVPTQQSQAGVSRALAEHYAQILIGADEAPFVQLAQDGLSFYLAAGPLLDKLEEQFSAHGIEYTSHDNSGDEPAPNEAEYPKQIIVPHGQVAAVMKLAQWHPADIEAALEPLYENQGLDYTKCLLKSKLETAGVGGLGIEAHWQKAQLIDGQTVIKCTLATQDFPAAAEAGHQHVDIVMDNSGSMSGDRIVAARAAVIQMINQLPDDATFTLRTFSKDTVFMEKGRKNQLPADWEDTINAINADCGGTPLVETVVAAASCWSDRVYTPGTVLKNHTIVVLTDGEGSQRESGKEILSALSTGQFRGQIMATKGLGTVDRPQRATVAVFAVGIGEGYNPQVIAELGFNGFCHVSDESLAKMGQDIAGAMPKLRGVTGRKTGPVHAGLVAEDQVLVATRQPLLIANTPESRPAYFLLPADQEVPDALQAIIHADDLGTTKRAAVAYQVKRSAHTLPMFSLKLNPATVSAAAENQLKHDYFRSRIDGVNEEFIQKATAMTSGNGCYSGFQGGRGGMAPAASATPAAATPSPLDALKATSKAQLDEISAQAKDNLSRVKFDEFKTEVYAKGLKEIQDFAGMAAYNASNRGNYAIRSGR